MVNETRCVEEGYLFHDDKSRQMYNESSIGGKQVRKLPDLNIQMMKVEVKTILQNRR